MVCLAGLHQGGVAGLCVLGSLLQQLKLALRSLQGLDVLGKGGLGALQRLLAHLRSLQVVGESAQRLRGGLLPCCQGHGVLPIVAGQRWTSADLADGRGPIGFPLADLLGGFFLLSKSLGLIGFAGSQNSGSGFALQLQLFKRFLLLLQCFSSG